MQRDAFFFLFIIVFCCLNQANNTNFVDAIYSKEKNKITNIISESIIINNDNDLLQNAKNFSWSGSGSENDPITINNTLFQSSIDQNIQLDLSNTRLNILIENCTFVQQYNRNFTNQFTILYLFNVQNIKLINNTFISRSDYTHSIDLTSSKDIEISNNIITGFENGVSGNLFSEVKVINNAILNNSWGIDFQNSNTTIIKENYFSNDIWAILLSRSSINISKNLFDNNLKAIGVNRGIGTIIQYNTIQSNKRGIELNVNTFIGVQLCQQQFQPECNETNSYITSDVIRLHYSNVTIFKNIFYNQSDFAIYIDNYTDSNVIYGNNFINNSLENSASHELTPGTVSIQVREELNQTTKNEWYSGTLGNYWSEYNGPDQDNNSIGDISMSLEVRNFDYFPSMIPIVIQSSNVTKLSIPSNFWNNFDNKNSFFQILIGSVRNISTFFLLVSFIVILIIFVYSYIAFTRIKRNLIKTNQRTFSYFFYIKTGVKEFFLNIKGIKKKNTHPQLDEQLFQKLQEIIVENQEHESIK